jgi:CHAD domain-containing protein
MPFCFKKSESIEKAVRRVCDERVRKAREWLEKPRRPSAIHNVRKEIKKLRALLRLVRGEIGREDYLKAVKALRGAAERLALARDARVIFRALEKLAEDPAKQFPKLFKFLRKNWRRETRRLRQGEALPEAERVFRKLGQRLRKLKLKCAGWSAVGPGLNQTYERAQELFVQAVRRPIPENLHAWRKQVKNLWYELQLLCPEWSESTREMVDELEALGEGLGDDHDMVLLREFIVEHGPSEAGERTALTELIEAHQKKMRVVALAVGRALFLESPSEFCRRLEIEWSAWRGR